MPKIEIMNTTHPIWKFDVVIDGRVKDSFAYYLEASYYMNALKEVFAGKVN